MIEAAALKDLDRVRHGFFTREGGRSQGIYASLNCGHGSDDDTETVRHNRAVVTARMGVTPDRLVTVWQHHSPDVIEVLEPWDPLHPPKADAMVTTRPGLALGVLTADCAPVLFASADGRVVGAAHAGWKGAIGGVLEATVEAMQGLGARRETIRAAIGPTIGPVSYEVGPEFRQRFLAEDEANACFFVPSPNDGHAFFDLPAYVLARLKRAGIGTLSDARRCTYADAARFFSYRRTTHRGEPDYGRQISVITIQPS